VKVEKRVVNDLPQVSNLEQDATIFLTCAKRAIQSVGEVLNQFYGTTISNARIDKGLTQLQKLNPGPANQPKVLESFGPLVERILNLRNFQEHTPKKTVVENFKLTVAGFQAPTWRVDPQPPVEMLTEMREIIDGLVEFAENVFFVGLLDSVVMPAELACFVEEIPEAEREGAIRYRCSITFVQPPKKSGTGVQDERSAGNIDSKPTAPT